MQKKRPRKPPRKQDSPSDVHRRQTARSRNKSAKAVRAILQNGPFVQPPPSVPGKRRKGSHKVKPDPRTLPAEDIRVYQVYRDKHGIVYLRVAYTRTGAAFIVNKGFSVELVDIDSSSLHASGLALKPVPGASIYETAKRLLSPLNDQCTISLRASEHLTTILRIKELQKMATKKSATPTSGKPGKFGTVTAPAGKPVKGQNAATDTGKKKPAAAAAAGKKGKKGGDGEGRGPGRSLDSHVITCKLKENPLREGTFCHAQVAACMKSNGKTVAQAQVLLDKSGANPNGRRLEVSWLVKKGYITTKEA